MFTDKIPSIDFREANLVIFSQCLKFSALNINLGKYLIRAYLDGFLLYFSPFLSVKIIFADTWPAKHAILSKYKLNSAANRFVASEEF